MKDCREEVDALRLCAGEAVVDALRLVRTDDGCEDSADRPPSCPVIGLAEREGVVATLMVKDPQ